LFASHYIQLTLFDLHNMGNHGRRCNLLLVPPTRAPLYISTILSYGCQGVIERIKHLNFFPNSILTKAARYHSSIAF